MSAVKYVSAEKKNPNPTPPQVHRGGEAQSLLKPLAYLVRSRVMMMQSLFEIKRLSSTGAKFSKGVFGTSNDASHRVSVKAVHLSRYSAVINHSLGSLRHLKQGYEVYRLLRANQPFSNGAHPTGVGLVVTTVALATYMTACPQCMGGSNPVHLTKDWL